MLTLQANISQWITLFNVGLSHLLSINMKHVVKKKKKKSCETARMNVSYIFTSKKVIFYKAVLMCTCLKIILEHFVVPT